MPEQKFVSSDSNAEKQQRDGTDIGHGAAADACHKMSHESSDEMRYPKACDNKPKPKDDSPSLTELFWDFVLFG